MARSATAPPASCLRASPPFPRRTASGRLLPSTRSTPFTPVRQCVGLVCADGSECALASCFSFAPSPSHVSLVVLALFLLFWLAPPFQFVLSYLASFIPSFSSPSFLCVTRPHTTTPPSYHAQRPRPFARSCATATTFPRSTTSPRCASSALSASPSTPRRGFGTTKVGAILGCTGPHRPSPQCSCPAATRLA